MRKSGFSAGAVNHIRCQASILQMQKAPLMGRDGADCSLGFASLLPTSHSLTHNLEARVDRTEEFLRGSFRTGRPAPLPTMLSNRLLSALCLLAQQKAPKKAQSQRGLQPL